MIRGIDPESVKVGDQFALVDSNWNGGPRVTVVEVVKVGRRWVSLSRVNDRYPAAKDRVDYRADRETLHVECDRGSRPSIYANEQVYRDSVALARRWNVIVDAISRQRDTPSTEAMDAVVKALGIKDEKM